MIYLINVTEMEAVILSLDQKVRIQVQIHGQYYTIKGTEPREHVRHVAELVDTKMNEISSVNPLLDAKQLAVLTAVNAVHDLVKLQERVEELEKELLQLKD